MTVAPPIEIQARIRQIQSRFDASQLTANDAATTDSAFASALTSALADGADPSALTDLLTNRAATSGGSATKSAVTGEAAVGAAMKYLGVPYQWGGTDPESGLDCSGLVQLVYRELGVELPRVSRDQAKFGTKVDSIEDALPGDLVAFGSPVNHIGIYVGDGKILHAPRSGEVVQVSDISRTITAIRRVIPEATEPKVDLRSLPGSTIAASGAASASAGTASGAAGKASPYLAMFEAAGAKYNLPPALLAAVAQTESNFNPSAVSSAGARGLMQFMPATARSLGIDPNRPDQAIDGAARYLRTQLDRFGSTELALAAYNAGPGAVSRFGGVPPYTETRNYVRKVTSAMTTTSTWFGANR